MLGAELVLAAGQGGAKEGLGLVGLVGATLPAEPDGEVDGDHRGVRGVHAVAGPRGVVGGAQVREGGVEVTRLELERPDLAADADGVAAGRPDRLAVDGERVAQVGEGGGGLAE